MEFLTAALLFLVVLLVIFRHWPPRSSLGPLPPGPKGLPFIGSILTLGRHEIKTFVLWKQKYGDICCFKVGRQLVVLLNSYRSMKECFLDKTDAFTGRPNAKYLRKLVKNSGIVLNDGPVWQEHRRFVLHVLRDFGFGRSLSEDSVTAEWQQLQQRLDVVVGRPIEIRPFFVATVNNVIARLAFGERTGVEDPEFPTLTRKLDVFFSGFTFSSLLPVIFPFIMRIKPLLRFLEKLTPLKEAMAFSHLFVRRKINEHRIALGESRLTEMDLSQAKDVCDALLIERARLESEGKVNHSFTDWQIIRDLLELFIAGTDTTATSLSWATFFMATNPAVQKRVHEEIDSVIGQSRCVAMKDRLEMPYVCATTDEVFRRSSVARSGAPRRVMFDTELMGYAIPKDTIVMPNMYGIHHDPKVWQKPMEFYPEHFLDSEGRYKTVEHLNPFSMGKRACLGEGLARMEFFLFFVGLMQSYNVEMADPNADIEKIDLGTMGNVRRPLPHEVVLTKRY